MVYHSTVCIYGLGLYILCRHRCCGNETLENIFNSTDMFCNLFPFISSLPGLNDYRHSLISSEDDSVSCVGAKTILYVFEERVSINNLSVRWCYCAQDIPGFRGGQEAYQCEINGKNQ